MMATRAMQSAAAATRRAFPSFSTFSAFAPPPRSAIYLPASNERNVAKAQTLDADAVILDIEDAVAASDDAKENARSRAVEAAWGDAYDFGKKSVVVRINGFGTPWHDDDVAAVRDAIASARKSGQPRARRRAVLLPKTDNPAQVSELANRLSLIPDDGVKLWCMIETPAGVENALSISAAEPAHLECLVMGTVDLANELQCDPHFPERGNMMYHLQKVVCVARASGRYVLDGVYTNLENARELRDECAQGASLGFDGKTAIHPKQIKEINDAFTPSEAQIKRATRVIDAHTKAVKEGSGVCTLDGFLVEALHVRNAGRVLAAARRD